MVTQHPGWGRASNDLFASIGAKWRWFSLTLRPMGDLSVMFAAMLH